MEDCKWRRWIARHFQIDRQDHAYAASGHKASSENSTADRACSNGQDPFRVGHSFVSFHERPAHVLANRPNYQQHIRSARRSR